jgi:hypothetical protein
MQSESRFGGFLPDRLILAQRHRKGIRRRRRHDCRRMRDPPDHRAMMMTGDHQLHLFVPRDNGGEVLAMIEPDAIEQALMR